MTIPAPPGWYPDPRQAGTDRYWDGTSWTESTTVSYSPPPPPTRPSLGPGWFQLAGALQGVIALYFLVVLAGVGVSLWTAQVTDDWARRPRSADVSKAELIDQLAILSFGTYIAFFLVTAILFITWLYRAHRSDRMYPAALHHGSGWAIGGWFVPILGFWRPVQMVNDVRRGAVGHEPATGTELVGTWWFFWIVSFIAGRAINGVAPTGDEGPREYFAALHDMAVAEVVSGVADALALATALLVVRHVTRLVRDTSHGSRPGSPYVAVPTPAA